MNPLQKFIADKTPDGWETRPFWSMFQRVKQTGYADEELLSVYRDYGVIPKSSRDDNHNKESEDLSGYQLVDKGWLVTNKMKAWQGSIAISRYRGIVSPAYYAYKPLSKEHDQFLHYLLRSANYIALYGRISKGVRVNQWDLEHEALRSIPVLLPSYDKQKEIADFLDRETSRIEQLIEKKAALIGLLSEKKNVEVISDCSGLTNAPRIQPNKKIIQELVHGVGLPDDWKIGKFHSVFTVRKSNKNIGMIENNLLSLSYGKIVRKDMSSNEGLTPESYETYQIVSPGDIVLRLTDLQNDKRSIRQGLVRERGIVTSAYDAVYVSSDHDPEFWAYTLLSLDLAKYYYSLGGGVRQSVKFGDIPNMLVKFPNRQKQKEISSRIKERVEKIDIVIKRTESSISLLKDFRASLITNTVTGQLNIQAWQKRGQTDRSLDRIEEEIEQKNKKPKKVSA
jgi:type I restriction enzyme S subunit